MVDTSSHAVLISGTEMAHRGYGLLDLFWQADGFVKLIMLLLIAASFLSWTIIFSKTRSLLVLRKSSRILDRTLRSCATLGHLADIVKKANNQALTGVFDAATQEMSRWGRGTKDDRIHHLDRLMQSFIRSEMTSLERHMGVLATTGSVAPFLGLLGTVWGIMNSFQSIAVSKNTSLDVVAPGIAEALAATALGLLVAIPAVTAYNKLMSSLGEYASSLETFCDHLYGLYVREAH